MVNGEERLLLLLTVLCLCVAETISNFVAVEEHPASNLKDVVGESAEVEVTS